MCLFYLVFGIDEAVVDELLVVAVLTDAVDCRSGVQVLGRGHLMIMMMMVVMTMLVMILMMMMMLMIMIIKFLGEATSPIPWNSILPSCMQRADTL